MSRAHVRVPASPPRRRRWMEFVLGGMMVLFIALFATMRLERNAGRSYFTTPGTVLETRIAVDHISDSRSGGQIYYRIEVHVSYSVEGLEQDRWLTASEATTEREQLAARLAARPKTCRVYWVPKHPENAKCRLE